MKTLVAYKEDAQLKTKMLREVRKHRKADQILQGTYGRDEGKDWKGCAVACSLRSLAIINKEPLVTEYNQHSRYESDLGIPETIAYLEDRIFEGLPKEKAQVWPEQFLKAIKPGADLSLVTPKFMAWLMGDLEQYAKDSPYVLASLKQVVGLYRRIIDGGTVSDKEWAAAWAAAEAAAWVAEAAEAAAWVAEAAEAAAEAAAWVAEAAGTAAEAAVYERMAEKLLELLAEAK